MISTPLLRPSKFGNQQFPTHNSLISWQTLRECWKRMIQLRFTPNVTQKSNPKFQQSYKSQQRNASHEQGYNSSFRKYRAGNSRNNPRLSWPNQNGSKSYRANLFCHFYEIIGHDTRDCIKLAKFLKDNNISVSTLSIPVLWPMLPCQWIPIICHNLGSLIVALRIISPPIHQHYKLTLIMEVQMRFFWVMVTVFPFSILSTLHSPHNEVHYPYLMFYVFPIWNIIWFQ